MTGADNAGRLFVFARHAESTANAAGVVNADPARHVPLTKRGQTQARQLGVQLAGLRIDIAVATRLLRTQQTAELALGSREVPLIIEPAFDEIHAGSYDGSPVDAYRAWEIQHTTRERLPDGESVDEALLRIAEGLRRLLSRTEPVTLVVLHSFALHKIANAVGSPAPPGDAPFGNAVPYLFHEDAITRAAAALEGGTSSASPSESASSGPR